MSADWMNDGAPEPRGERQTQHRWMGTLGVWILGSITVLWIVSVIASLVLMFYCPGP